MTPRHLLLSSLFALTPLCALAADGSAIPNFSGYWERPEAGSARVFYPPAEGPGPLVNTDPDDQFMIGDDTNPILQLHAAAAVKTVADAGRRGEVLYPAWSLCWPPGVPLVLNMAEPVQFLQEEDMITILYQRGMTVRRIYLNEAHPENIPPSWFGHSVGHYEGGKSLVVDTIAQDTRSETDRFGTPKSPAMRVVERYTLSDDGTRLRVDFMVEDLETFTAPWRSYVEYVWPSERNGGDPADAKLIEVVCAENNRDVTTGGLFPIPQNNGAPDF
jgi:hypothetical protein